MLPEKNYAHQHKSKALISHSTFFRHVNRNLNKVGQQLIMNHTAGQHSTDLPDDKSQRFNASASSDITVDFSGELDDFSDLDDSCSSEEDDDSIYEDYRQMLTAGNRTTKKKPQEHEQKTSTHPTRTRFCRVARTNRSSTAKAFDPDTKLPVAQKHVPGSDETILTQQTASVTSLGSAEFQWFASGGERKEGESTTSRRRAKINISSKNRESIHGVSRFFRRGGR